LIVKDIQDLLSNDEALVLFASGDKETYVFAVTPTAVAAKIIPLGAQALSEKIAAFRRGLKALRQETVGGKPAFWGPFSIIGEGWRDDGQAGPPTRRGVNPHDTKPPDVC